MIIEELYCKRCGGTVYYSSHTCRHLETYGDGTFKKEDLVKFDELTKEQKDNYKEYKTRY